MPSIFAPQSTRFAARTFVVDRQGPSPLDVRPVAATADFWSDAQVWLNGNWPYVLFGGGSLIFIAYVWWVLASHWPKE